MTVPFDPGPDSWFYVLVQMKNVFRIVLLFELSKSDIVRAIGRRHPIILVSGHEVYIGTRRRIRRGRFEKRARPTDATIILLFPVQRPCTFTTNLASRCPYAMESPRTRFTAPEISPTKISHWDEGRFSANSIISFRSSSRSSMKLWDFQ